MESIDAAQLHRTRCPGSTPRAARLAAATAVRSRRAPAREEAGRIAPVHEDGSLRVAVPAGRPHPGQRAAPPPDRPAMRAPDAEPSDAAAGRANCQGATARHSLADMTPRRIAIVPHSHWDREWYESYQEFRLNLVDMLDTLLPLLESDASYPYFMLDGQMAVVDDYLEVRPEAEPRLRALAAAGRISMGPWYILMDEFLSSGETIIRNLEMGIVRGAAFGGVMDVGYLPDMFGHIAQMPQILRAGGIRPCCRLARRALGRHQGRLLLGGARRVDRAGRVPPRRLRERGGAARRRQGARPPHRGPGQGDRAVPDRRPAVHERFGPPLPPTRGWDGSWPKPTTCRTTSSSRSPRCPATSPAPPPKGWSAGRESCARGSAPTC